MMNKKDIFAKIGTIVKEIHEQHEYLLANPESLNELELELFLANSKFLTGHIEVFQKLARAEAGSQPVAIQTEPLAPSPGLAQAPVAETEPVAAQSQQQERAGDIEEPISTTIVLAPPPPVYQKEQAIDIAGDLTEQEQVVNKIYLDVEPIEDEPIEEEPEEAFAEAPREDSYETEEPAEEILPELVVEEPTINVPEPIAVPAQASPTEPEHVPTLNDVISAQLKEQPTLAGKFTAQPVKDLKSIISLNDKLLFIKDLFNGYSLAYSEAIELLNRFDNFEAADNFLKSNYATKNNWSTKQSTADHFYELLNRRFGG